MLMVLILMCGRRRVRQPSNISLARVSVISNDLALHSADASVMRMQLSSLVCSRRHTLPHLEERVHLLLITHLVAEDAIRPQVVRLM